MQTLRVQAAPKACESLVEARVAGHAIGGPNALRSLGFYTLGMTLPGFRQGSYRGLDLGTESTLNGFEVQLGLECQGAGSGILGRDGKGFQQV